jgi:hypothetical protein
MKRLAAFVSMLVLSGSALAQAYDGIPDRFFGFLAKGQMSESIDYLYAMNRWVDPKSDQATNLKGELAKLSRLVGKYLFHELVVEQKVGAHYAHLIYLVGYERQPVRFEIRVYKPGAEWRFQGVSFDARVTDDIDKLANGKLAK